MHPLTPGKFRIGALPLVLVGLCFVSSCSEGPAGPPKSENWKAVESRLQQGGVIYGIVDIDGDLEYLTGSVIDFLRGLQQIDPDEVPLPDLPYEQLVEATGLTSVTEQGQKGSVQFSMLY